LAETDTDSDDGMLDETVATSAIVPAAADGSARNTVPPSKVSGGSAENKSGSVPSIDYTNQKFGDNELMKELGHG